MTEEKKKQILHKMTSDLRDYMNELMTIFMNEDENAKDVWDICFSFSVNFACETIENIVKNMVTSEDKKIRLKECVEKFITAFRNNIEFNQTKLTENNKH